MIFVFCFPFLLLIFHHFLSFCSNLKILLPPIFLNLILHVNTCNSKQMAIQLAELDYSFAINALVVGASTPIRFLNAIVISIIEPC